MTTMPDQAKLDRIKAIRAKADSLLAQDPDHPEGLEFQAKFLNLLAKYSLDEAAIAADGTSAPVECVQYAFPGRTWAVKRYHLIHHVCAAFELPHTYFRMYGDAPHIVMITGRRAAIDAALAVAEFLLPQLQLFIIKVAASDTYLQHYGTARRQFASQAIDAWLGTLRQRVHAAYYQAKQEEDTASDERALVLADTFNKAVALLKDRTQEHMEANNIAEGPALPALRVRDAAAYHLGADEANRTDIGLQRTGTAAYARAALEAQ